MPGSMAEFVGVGGAARGKGGAQFMRLLAVEILPEQEIVREPRETTDPTMAGAGRVLDRRQWNGAALGDFERHVARRLFQPIVRHDPIDHAELQRLARREALE